MSTNEQVARAMGWTFHQFLDGMCPDVKHWYRPGFVTGNAQLDGYWPSGKPRAYDTDPATIPEMLAWLWGRSGSAGIDIAMVSPVYVNAVLLVESAISDCHDSFAAGSGATIQAALAALVLAVKAREEQERGTADGAGQ